MPIDTKWKGGTLNNNLTLGADDSKVSQTYCKIFWFSLTSITNRLLWKKACFNLWSVAEVYFSELEQLTAYCVCVCVCVCVCLYSSTCWFFWAARRLTYVRSSDQQFFIVSIPRGFCQVPASLFLNLSYFTSKDETSSRLLTGEKTIWYNFCPRKDDVYWYRI